MQDTLVHVTLTDRQTRALADITRSCTALGAYFSLEENKQIVYLTRGEMVDAEARLTDALKAVR